MTEATKYLRHCRKEYGPDDLRTKAAFAARAAEVESEEVPQPGIWYLSFAGEKFLGAAFVSDVHSVTSAVKRAHDLGINPGGEVLCCPPNFMTASLPDRWKNRLLSRSDLDALDTEMMGDA